MAATFLPGPCPTGGLICALQAKPWEKEKVARGQGIVVHDFAPAEAG